MKKFNFDLQKEEKKEEFEREKTIYITRPIPLSPEWHKLTNWRNAEELYKNFLPYWNEWKSKSIIPINVILRVEGKD